MLAIAGGVMTTVCSVNGIVPYQNVTVYVLVRQLDVRVRVIYSPKHVRSDESARVEGAEMRRIVAKAFHRLYLKGCLHASGI